MLFLSGWRVRKFLLLFLAVLSAHGAEIKINFSEFSAGQSPTNFSAVLAGNGAAGDWKIISEEAPPAFSTPLMPQVAPTPSPARRGVLAQLSQDPTDDRYPIMVYDGENFKNFKATMPFKIVSGATEQMAGMVFRFQNASNFYVVRVSALGHNLRFYKVVNGRFQDPTTPFNINISANSWHTLTVQCEGNRIDCWLDSFAAPSVQTPNTFEAGKIGFWTKSDAVSYFGDTTVDYTPMVPAAQTLVRDILKEYPRIVNLRIYMPDDKGDLRIVAGKNEADIGKPGTDAEKKTYEKGAVFYGHEKGTVAVNMPLNDRNGEPVAVVRVQLKSYSMAETQEMVLTRVRIITKEMQKRVLSKEDLM
jgi:hypothetical protein